MSEYFLKLITELDRGVAKNQFAVFMESIAFDLKRMVVLDEEYCF